MKHLSIICIGYLSMTSFALANFAENAEATGNAVAVVTDAVKGQTRVDNAKLSATNIQSNSDVTQNGLVNINRNGSIHIESGTNASGATMTATNIQSNSDVKQNGLKNINENGTISVGND
ncbi:MAG: Unknown protein [uncultured Sulfurovum sp.]|uniref:Uncharacterized protein n=1 Tax=uncultured Sulfurovum sp. TaxID=269237 RepID=A0A6S6S107_9BACT|nr:MAG: Unknown protein [uncultured Sulfurovum sp.]